MAILGNEDNDNSESVTTQENYGSTALVVDDSLPVRMQMNAALKPFTSRVDLGETGEAKDTPIILLTGNSSPADRIKGNLSGCDTYLIKPISQMVFKEIIIDQYLNNHSLPRRAAS
jgi:DNA-binding NarL/FixJ family response regulator